MPIMNKLPLGGGASNSVPSEGWTQLPSAINTALGVNSFIIFNNEVYGFGGDFNRVTSEYRHWGVKYNGTAWTDITNTIMAIQPITVLYGEVLGNEIYLFDSAHTVYKYRNGHPIQVDTTNSGGNYGGYYYISGVFRGKQISCSKYLGDSYVDWYINSYDHVTNKSQYLGSIKNSNYIRKIIEYNNQLYIFASFNNFVYVSSDGSNYTELTLPRQLSTAVVYHDKLHLFWNDQFNCTGDNSPHYIYDGMSFTKIGNTPPNSFSKFFVYNDALHIINGANIATHYIYNDSDDSFTKVSWLCSK